MADGSSTLDQAQNKVLSLCEQLERATRDARVVRMLLTNEGRLQRDPSTFTCSKQGCGATVDHYHPDSGERMYRVGQGATFPESSVWGVESWDVYDVYLGNHGRLYLLFRGMMTRVTSEDGAETESLSLGSQPRYYLPFERGILKTFSLEYPVKEGDGP